jgi:hypothetical protein
MREGRLGERSRLLREVGEISSMARSMAVAAIGLRGYAATKAMNDARRKLERERWQSICAVADAKRQRIILRDEKQLEQRVKTLLNGEASSVSIKVIEAGLAEDHYGSST